MINIEKEELEAFGIFKEYVLLGGGELLLNFSLWLKLSGFKIRVITSPRHSVECIGFEKFCDTLEKNQIDYLITEDIESSAVINFINPSKNVFFLSIGAAWIFKKHAIINIFNDKLFNLHGSRLPQNRGGGGFSWQILTNNKFGFCVLHLVDKGIDTGDIIQFEEFLYPATCRIPIDYEKIYIEKNLLFLKKIVKGIHDKNVSFQRVTQQEYFSSYWPRLNTKVNGWIDWSLEAIEIERFICAFDSPYEGANTYVNNGLVRVKKVMLSQQDGMFHSYQSGIIYRKNNNWICVALKNYSLIIEEVYDESCENIIDHLKVGDRFHTPIDKISLSKSRVIYTPKKMKEITL